MELLPLDEVRRRLRVVGQAHLGVRAIPVAQIVGSLDRYADFDREFRPLHAQSRRRIAGLRSAFPDGVMPPIEAYEVGGAYFVSDGHHRVALARERGAAFVDAEVTRLHTNYELAPDVDVCALVHTEQQRALVDESGLAQARPEAVIEFSRPGGYAELLELIKAHGYDLARERGALPSAADVAADWYDRVYLPGVAALRREAMHEAHDYKTDADMFLCVYQRRRALRVTDRGTDFGAAARDARNQRVSRRFRRRFLRERGRPLGRRT